MGHADLEVADAELAAALPGSCSMPGISDSLSSRPKRCAEELDAQIAFQALGLDDALEDGAAALDGELGVVLVVLMPLLDPRLLVRIRDALLFDADLAAVGLAQAVPDLALCRRSRRDH